MSTASNKIRWDDREEYLYFFFLRMKYDDFQTYSMRKSTKVFDYFSHLVGTKNRSQVKSYHQRLMKKHLKIDSYLDFYESNQGNKIFQLEDKYLTNKIRNVAKINQERKNLKFNQLYSSSSSIENMQIDSPIPESLSQSKESSITIEEVQ